MSKALLNEFAAKCNIQRVGVASIERFANIPPQFHPASICPEAKSVIVCMQEIPRGVFRGVEEGVLWQRADRQIEAYYMYQFARLVEDQGYLGVPVSPLAQERWPEGVRFRKGKVEPNVYPSLPEAAVLAGLGEIGFCGLFLSRQYGLRQALGMVITDWAIPEDPLFEGHVCDREACAACVAACPMGALDPQNAQVLRIGEQSFSVCALHKDKCRYCLNGAFRDSTFAQAEPNRLTAACGRACLAHLEESGALEKTYVTPFRRREPWGKTLRELR